MRWRSDANGRETLVMMTDAMTSGGMTQGEFTVIIAALRECSDKLGALRLAFVAGLPECKNALAAYEQAHNRLEEAILTARERLYAECAQNRKEAAV